MSAGSSGAGPAGRKPEVTKDGSLADRLIAQLLDAEELIGRPPPSWLVDDVLPAGGTTVLYGKPGSYKTFTAIDWAACVGLGWHWQARETKQGLVLYIAAEGVGGLGIRVEAWKRAFSADKLTG
jgi:hypothetical protein